MAETASHLAREKPNMVVHSLSVVIFRAGGAWLALPSISVREIIGPRPVHSLPHRRGGAVLGLVNIRGELLVCLALPVVLGLDLPGEDESRPGQAPSRMLVTQQNNARIVYPVEEVAAVQRFQPQDCAPAPALVTKAPANFTKAVLNWRGTPVSLLDEQQLLTTVNRSLASATAT
jgi:chemotaxis-related protein WspD